MLGEQKHLSVNWVNGMKVSSQNFVEMENWVHDRVKDVNGMQLTDYNYGLLAPAHPDKQSLELDTSMDQVGQLNLKLYECRAITRGGHRIEITRSLSQQQNLALDFLHHEFNLENAPNQQFDIIISVNPFKRIPVGNAAPQETPFRPPFVIPEYKLDIIPADQSMSSNFWFNHLVIGKFQVISGEVNFFAEYVPPATSLNAHPLLIQHHREFSTRLDQLGRNCILILRKLRYKEQKSRLDLNIIQMMTTLSDYIAENADRFEYDLPYQSPLRLVMYFKTMFRKFKNDLQKLIDFERDELMQYLSRWISSSELDDEITRAISQKYDHINCNYTFQLIEKIMEKLRILTEKLSGSSQERIPYMAPPPPPTPVEEETKVEEPPAKPKINIVRNRR